MYTFELINGHLIALIGDGRYLIDTGSPISFGDGRVTIDKTNHQLATDLIPGLTITSLSEQVGTPLNGLIGADILQKHRGLFVWNYKNEINFKRCQSSEATPITLIQGIPVVNITINGQDVHACIDTGAQYSYVSAHLAKDTPREERVTDFYPTLGTFTAEQVKLTYQEPSNNETKSFLFAVLPSNLDHLLQMLDSDVILGLDWLREGKSHFQIDYQNETFSNY